MRLRGDWVAVGVVFTASMIVYLLTLCPTVYGGDSGDLITASYTLGVAHPAGYPFYMLVGKLFSLIPYGTIAYRYNLMSAVFCALTAVFTCMSIRLLSKSWSAGVGGGLLIAYSAVIWDQATVAEAYGIHGFFVALLVWLTLRWREHKGRDDLVYITVVYGLSLTNHVSMILYLPAFIYLIWAGNSGVLRKLDFRGVVVSFLAPLIIYAYIPLRAAGNPPYSWGNPSSLGRFLNHITGFVHRQTYVFILTKGEVFERFFGVLFHYLRQFSLLGVLVLGGLYGYGGKRKVFLGYTGIMVAADIVYALFLNDVSIEITPFCIPSIIVLGIWSGFGFMDMFKWLGNRFNDRRLVGVSVVVAAIILIALNYHISDRSTNLIAYDYGMNILKTVEDDAVIFAEGDSAVMPLSYLLLVEHVKPDVTM
jgi:hypothetical protein